MGWGTRPRHVEPYVPATGRLEYFEDLGHFIHIEAPEMTADLVLDFLGDPR
jgi:pimeloyl-ACP methyl ester carboxylesterase